VWVFNDTLSAAATNDIRR